VSVLMSLFVARMVTPLIAAYFLRSHGAQPHAAWRWMDVYLKVLNWSLDTSKAVARRARVARVPIRLPYWSVPIGIAAVLALLSVAMKLWKANPDAPPSAVMLIFAFIGTLIFASLVVFILTIVAGLILGAIGGFERNQFAAWSRSLVKLGWASMFDHRMAMVGAGIVTLLASAGLFAMIPQSFFPPQNSDYSRVNITLPPGTTLKQTEAITDHVAAIVQKDPTVERVFERIGVGTGHVNIVLKKKRDLTSTEFERKMSPTLAAIPDARVSFQSQNGGGPDPDQRDIMLYLGGDDPVQLTSVANQIAKQMESVPGLRAPRVGSQLAQPEITIKPRFDLAADLGVTTAALSQTVRIATLGDIEQNSAKFSLSDRQVPIQVSLSENDRRDLQTLMNLPVPTSSGGSVPLKAVAEIGFGSGPTTINRSNQLRRLAIGADLAPGVVEGDVWKKVNDLPAVKNLPQGVQ
jgi:multidrug efflux pump subunit AcrB